MYVDINGKLFCCEIPASGCLQDNKELVDAIEADVPAVKGQSWLWMQKVNDPRKYNSFLAVHSLADNEWMSHKVYKVFLNMPESILLATTPHYKMIQKDKDGNIVTPESIEQKLLKQALEQGYKFAATFYVEDEICTVDEGWTTKRRGISTYFRTWEDLENRIPEEKRSEYEIRQIA